MMQPQMSPLDMQIAEKAQAIADTEAALTVLARNNTADKWHTTLDMYNDDLRSGIACGAITVAMRARFAGILASAVEETLVLLNKLREERRALLEEALRETVKR